MNQKHPFEDEISNFSKKLFEVLILYKTFDKNLKVEYNGLNKNRQNDSLDDSESLKENTGIPLKRQERGNYSQILKFCIGEGEDQSGRKIDIIWNFTDEQLEIEHDYIQWIFPTSLKSEHNKYALTLTEEDMREFSEGEYSKILQDNMMKSFDRMLKFYGLKQINDSISIDESIFFTRKKTWLTARNHNFLRLTRILQSLIECGFKEKAISLHNCLKNDIYPSFIPVIGNSITYWGNIISPLQLNP